MSGRGPRLATGGHGRSAKMKPVWRGYAEAHRTRKGDKTATKGGVSVSRARRAHPGGALPVPLLNGGSVDLAGLAGLAFFRRVRIPKNTAPHARLAFDWWVFWGQRVQADAKRQRRNARRGMGTSGMSWRAAAA